jgi:uncharacterized protein involved in exopolysaccharide biosynthesis
MATKPVPVSAEQKAVESAALGEPIRVRAQAPQENPGVVDRLRLVIEERVFLFRVTSYGLALTTLLAFLIPIRYEAHTRLMPPDSELGEGLGSLLAMTERTGNGLGMLAGDLLGLKTSGSLFIGILRSQTVEDRIIAQFDLKSVYHVRLMQNARRELEANTQIAEDRKSGIIAIDVTDHSPQRAAAIAQAYVVELDRLVVELNTSAAHRERVFLEERLKSVKQDLDSSAKEFSQFASENTAVNIQEQERAMVEAAASLQGRLIASQSELEGLRQTYSDNNVRVRTVRARIEELQKKLEQMGSAGVGSAAGDGRSDALYPSIRKLPLLGVTYTDLYRKTKIQETLFELLTQECEMAKVQEAKETPSVKVLDPATVPEKKSFPPRLLIMLLGTVFAFMLGALWVLGQAQWKELDPQHPGKLLAREAYVRLKADLGLTSRNGSRLRHVRDRVLWFKSPSKKP